MADINIQFHATPDELLRFVKDCLQDFGIYLVAMRFAPFDIIEVSPDMLDAVFAEASTFKELGFTIRRPALPVKSNLDYYDKNPSGLRLDIQRPTDKGLRQTWLACRTDDLEALGVWKQIAKRLKSMTRTGVIVVNPDSGRSARSSSFRYSPGAKELEREGIPMLPAAGGNLLRFDA